MAHHGSGPFGDTNFEDFFKKSMPVDQSDRLNEALKKNTPFDLGATKKFPDGRLNESDEGEIRVAIAAVEDRVVIQFGKQISWIGFTKEQAKDLAALLLKHSE